MGTLNDTPRAERLHIGIFGKRNSGKSSLMNALTGQETAVVSDTPGTTTDPVYKSIEIPGIGPCVLIDTAGFDDVGEVGELRVKGTRLAAEKTDVAIILFTEDDMTEESEWVRRFRDSKIPVIPVVNRSDVLPKDGAALAARVGALTGQKPINVSAQTGSGLEELFDMLLAYLPSDYEQRTITADLANEGDTVLLVMPQDIEAPKGRLILPQVQTIRDLLDKKCTVISVTADRLEAGLKALRGAPSLIITDSQVFSEVYAKKPKKSRLTSFSVLFANYKGDIDFFTESVKVLDSLSETAHILIAEACTHRPLHEDIGRVKLPKLLKKKLGNKITIDYCNGQDFPENLTDYDLIIHCGACMFNRRFVISRASRAQAQGVPMTNYGIILAKLAGILDKIDIPSAK